VKILEASGETAWQLGKIVNGAGEVQYR
jgi:hypothetical protein